MVTLLSEGLLTPPFATNHHGHGRVMPVTLLIWGEALYSSQNSKGPTLLILGVIGPSKMHY